MPAGGAPPAPAPPAAPFAVFESQAAFDERMARAQRSHLREQFGTEDPAEVKTRLDRLKALEDAEAARAREQLTATQKLESDLAAARLAQAKAEEEAGTQRFRALVSQDCVALGIKNVPYALYVVGMAAEALPDGQQLDAHAHLSGLLAKPEYKSAFGITEAPTVVTQPVTTSPNPSNPAPAPPPAGGNNPAPVDAMSMSPAQFKAHLESVGAGGLAG